MVEPYFICVFEELFGFFYTCTLFINITFGNMFEDSQNKSSKYGMYFQWKIKISGMYTCATCLKTL